MSVEFLCPHCRAKMRTPDEVMGRETGCPKCHGRLTIPTVEIPEQESLATLIDDSPPATPREPASTAELPAFGEPAESEAVSFDFSAPVEPPASTTATSPVTDAETASPATAQPYRRRKKKSGWGMLAGIAVVVAAALGTFAYVMSNATPTMTGTLQATVVDAGSASSQVSLPPGVSTERMLAELSGDPVELRTDYFNTSFGGAENQLLVTVSKTDAGKMFEVDLNKDSGAAKFLSQFGDGLAAARSTSLANSANEMAIAVGKDPVDREAVVAYRDSVGMASLQNALGPHVIAEAGGFAHPVVSEPSPGVLRWILPAGTTSFVISRNSAQPANLPPTMRYTVTVGQ